jgi:hypothetical protein
VLVVSAIGDLKRTLSPSGRYADAVVAEETIAISELVLQDLARRFVMIYRA